jgi:RecB family exonuclease
MKISHFKLSMFLECPLKYKYYYIDNLKEYCKPKPYQSMGISVHNALEAFFRQKRRTLEMLHTLLRRYWVREGYSSKDEEREWGMRALSMLSNFYNKSDPNKEPEMLEAHFEVEFDGFCITGRIDRVDRTDTGYEIIDYKTGGTLTQEEADKDLQMSLYWLGLYHQHNISADKLTFYFLKDVTKITTTRTREQIEEHKVFLKECAERMEDTESLKPRPNRYCHLCDFTLLCPVFTDQNSFQFQ